MKVETTKYKRKLKKLFEKIKDVPAGEYVEINYIVVGFIDDKTRKLLKTEDKEIRISSRVLKHIYERRPGDINMVIEKIPHALCFPDQILFNIKTPGTVFFVIKNTKLFATLVEIDVESNEVITAFLTSERYLKKFGRPGRSDVPPSTTETWSASDQKISALQATRASITELSRKFKTSVVIPNYNGAGLLRENLPQVTKVLKHKNTKTREQENTNVEVIIVDDGSTDNSVEYIKYQISNIKYLRLIKSKFNRGFASAVNTGVKNANGDIVILLNTDVVPEKGFLEPLLRHFADPKVFAVGCMDKSVEKGKVVKRGRGVAWWERGFLMHKRGEVSKKDTFWVNGGSGAFRKSIWNKLGGMDELYNPFYWEDIDLSYRALKAGYKIVFEPESVVLHKHDEGAIKTQYSASEMKTIAYRNQFFFVWKNITDPKLLLSHILWLPYHKIKAVISLDYPFFKGLLLALINFPLVLRKRSQVWPIFKYDDQQIIHQK